VTYSDCWIDTVDDEDFRVFKAQQMRTDGETGRFGRLHVLPQPPDMSHYWLPVVKDWATERGLEIQWVDSAWIKVPVSRAQLQQFLDEVFETAPESPVAKLQAHVSEHFRDDKTYVIVAEEF
jgi:hypothetical protein